MAIDKKIRNLNPVGKDSIIGGVFFGSDMTPGGVFKNIPRYDYKPEITEKESELMLTLNKVKHSINDSLKSQDIQIENVDELSTFFNEYIDLLIDHRDLRNYIFYGSANTEISYQINNLIETFPYKTLISELYSSNDITINNYNINGKNKTDIIFPYYLDNNRSNVRVVEDNWNKFFFDDTNPKLNTSDLKVVDRNGKYFDITEVITPFKNDSENYIITNIENVSTITSGINHNSIKITTLQKINLSDPNFILDKVFQNGSLINLLLDVNGRQMVASKQSFRVLKKVSDNEILICRANNNTMTENISVTNITPGDVFGGIINFNNEYTTIYDLKNISNTTYGIRNLIGLEYIGGSINNIKYQTPTNYKIGDIISFYDAKKEFEKVELEYSVINTINNDYIYTLNSHEQSFKIIDIIHTADLLDRMNDKYELVIEREYKTGSNEEIQLDLPYDPLINMKSRYSDIALNGNKFWVKVTIDGYFGYENLITYTNKIDENKKGFLISPSKRTISLFDDSLSPLQKFLLSPSPINKTPWPRRPITNNIQNIIDYGFDSMVIEDFPDTEVPFYEWLNNPDLFHEYEFGELVEEIYSKNVFYEFQLMRALYNDENNTNQLLRRAIPNEILNELDDSEFYFGRFILIAGWFFDQIKVYVDFLKYTHTINYGEFNQLSPQFYKLYAEHYGFDLFEDEDIDFGKLIIQTEPGFYYSNDKTIEENKYFTKTLLQAQQERQKKLLVNLFYLYSIKGTKSCIEALVSLIGAPEGLLTIKEYSFQVRNLDSFGLPLNDDYTGDLIVDNEKIHIPEFKFEIDTDFLKDKVNINNPINKPYVYKKVLNNDYTHNLREISLDVSINDSISKHINTNYGEQLYNFIGLNEYEFSNLQKKDSFLLPLTIPDRYYGFSLELMIPHNSYKGIDSVIADESNYNLLNLYEISNANINTLYTISNVIFDESMINAEIQTSLPNGYNLGDNIFIMNNKGIVGLNGMFTITEIINPSTFIINGVFSYDGNNIEYGFLTLQGIIKPLQSEEGLSYSYPLPANYNSRNSATDGDTNGLFTNPNEDYNILYRRFPNSEFIDNKQYIMSRIEGYDIVFRVRLRDENTGVYYERVAICLNAVNDDGLVHSIRFTLLKEGILIYKDYEYFGLVKYMDLNSNSVVPILAYQASKQEILGAYNDTINCEFNYYSDFGDIYYKSEIGNLNQDSLNWWDMFTGLGENLNCFISRINIFENVTINDYNIGDKLTDNNSLTSELYLFDMVGDKTYNYKEDYNFNVPGVFYRKHINNIVDFYGYQLPTELDEFNRNIISDLSLSNKSLYDEITKNNYYINMKQDFFKKKDIFMYNAWFKEIQESYEYRLFNGDLNKLYNIFSQQILTFNSLREFMGFIESKFQNIISNFIPMVINISNFGNLVSNSDTQIPKMRFHNKFCTGIDINENSYAVLKVFKNSEFDDGVLDGEDIVVMITDTENGAILYNGTTQWFQNRVATLTRVSIAIKQAFNILGLTKSVVDVYSEQLRISLNYDEYFQFMEAYMGVGTTPNGVEILINGVFNYKLTFSNSKENDNKPELVNNCGVVLFEESKFSEDCGFINYVLPKAPNEEIFSYYKEEVTPDDVKPIYTFFREENNKVRTNIKFKNE